MKSYALDHPKLPPILLDLFFYLFPEFSYLFVGVLQLTERAFCVAVTLTLW